MRNRTKDKKKIESKIRLNNENDTILQIYSCLYSVICNLIGCKKGKNQQNMSLYSISFFSSSILQFFV